jgi:hypothetical protein
MSTPPVGGAPQVGQPFDPYRYGAPEHYIAPEYAPPGYVPPAHLVTPGTGEPLSNRTDQYRPPQQQWGAPSWDQYPRPRTGNGKAIASLVLGILSIFFSILSSLDAFVILPAIVFGALALADAKRTGSGRGMAITGITLALVGAVLAVFMTVVVAPRIVRCANDYGTNTDAFRTCVVNSFK